jgi:hypothetical protein
MHALIGLPVVEVAVAAAIVDAVVIVDAAAVVGAAPGGVVPMALLP